MKKQNPVDVAFKEKHQNYEQLQRQATTVCKLSLVSSNSKQTCFCHSENYFYPQITLISPFNLQILQNIDVDKFNNVESPFNESMSLFILNVAPWSVNLALCFCQIVSTFAYKLN